MTEEEYTAVDYLYDLANHFSYPDGWHWTRNSDIKRIQYNTVSEREKFLNRVTFTWSGLFGRGAKMHRDVFSPKGTSIRRKAYGMWITIKIRMTKDKHIPDGIIKDTGVIAFWEEDGEYICMMQPSVGTLVAEFIRAEPDNEWAKKISDELEDVRKRFWIKD